MPTPSLGRRSRRRRVPPASCSRTRRSRRRARRAASVASVDVQLANFAVNLHAYHPSAARAVGRLSELTLRDTDGGAALAVANLSAPIQIALPLAPDLETYADDANPYLGASCDGPSRAACEAELLALNETHNAKNDECRGVEGSAASIFTPSAVDECIAAAEAAAEAVRQKEAECEALEIEHCSGRGSCTAAGVCACDGGYYGATCGRVLQCAWWNESAGFEGSGCAAAGVDGEGRLVCECNHLTLFEVLWEVDWSDAETFTTIEFPMLSLPFSRWGQLWELLWSLSWQAYVLVAVVLVVLSILLLWARYKDRQNEYVAYMPRWYRAVRAVETAARHSDRCVVRIAAWPVLFILWFATNHPWIVVFLVKPSSSFKHAHLVMMLYNMVLAELCFFVVFFGYEQSAGQTFIAILLDEGLKWILLLVMTRLFLWAMREPEIQSLELEDSERFHLVFRQTAPFVWPRRRFNLCEHDHLSDNFSKLGALESFRDADGSFTFKLRFPGTRRPTSIWKQSSNPLTDADVADYVPVRVPRRPRSLPLAKSPHPELALVVGGAPEDGESAYYAIGHRLLQTESDREPKIRKVGNAVRATLRNVSRRCSGGRSSMPSTRGTLSLRGTLGTGTAKLGSERASAAGRGRRRRRRRRPAPTAATPSRSSRRRSPTARRARARRCARRCGRPPAGGRRRGRGGGARASRRTARRRSARGRRRRRRSTPSSGARSCRRP